MLGLLQGRDYRLCWIGPGSKDVIPGIRPDDLQFWQSRTMRWTDRLTLPQKIVLIIALGLALGAFGDSVPTLATTTTRFTGFLPEPAYQSTLTLHMPLVSGWLGLIIWLVLIAVWALLSIRILRPAPEQPPRG